MGPLAVDHLVLATHDLPGTVDDLAARVGVRAELGGRHLGGGTYNFLLHLGGDTYLEIIAPDPEHPAEPGRPLAFGLDDLRPTRLAGFAVRTDDLAAVVARARGAGYDPGRVMSMERRRPDGVLLRWQLAIPQALAHDGLVPFVIDWLDAPHPSASTPQGCTLVGLRAEHPTPELVRRDLAALGVELAVGHAAVPALIAVIEGPAGRIELR